MPNSVVRLPPSFLAEAIGQLAGWAAMVQTDFVSRPVAALAGEVIVLGEAVAGDKIELSVHFDGREHGGVIYGGSATTNGRTLLTMNRCVGPLLPMEEFDDPSAVRASFRRLREGSASPGLEPVAPNEGEPIAGGSEAGLKLRVALDIPRRAAFFADHFPRKPVYPATILLDDKIRVALRLLRPSGGAWHVRRATRVKFGAFLSPGEHIELEATRIDDRGMESQARVEVIGIRRGERISRARFEFLRDGL